MELADTDMATQGDPMSPLQWTSKSLENIRAALEKAGFSASAPVISAILKRSDCSMQANCKRFEGSTAAERDSQFKYISAYAKSALERHEPLISVDGKKKENAGLFKNGGKECSKAGCPIQANAYDFMDKKPGKAAPCGIYEADGGEGALADCGADHDAAEFAVYSIEQWRLKMGVQKYPRAHELIIACGGGGNGSRVRLFKHCLQAFSNKIEFKITVLHFPPGTSKRNAMEHRLFSAISMNWRGRPLTSLEVIASLIANAASKSGLAAAAMLDTNAYETKIKISGKDFEKINLTRHAVNPNLNYTISPSN
ncbi:MAG: ISAzo13 family transposase [Clostridiales bacterium]|nr:ISAzo13 family transposase [Clostridiales bacterium]